MGVVVREQTLTTGALTDSVLPGLNIKGIYLEILNDKETSSYGLLCAGRTHLAYYI